MKLLADAHITGVSEAFSPLGELELFEKAPLRGQLRRADVLLVRTTVQVDAELLHETPIQYVGSASAGIDHVDVDGLARVGVECFHAPGCNAGAVADYVISVASCLTVAHAPWSELTVGIVGCGEVGRRVRDRCRALGCRVLVNDPPREQAGEAGLLPLSALLDEADVLTLHVPLTADGPFPTRDLLDGARLNRLKPGACLLNTARGGVVDETALSERIAGGPELLAAFDCWLDEPAIDRELASKAWLATPHIAGYSRRGKLEASRQVHRQLCRRLGRRDDWPLQAEQRRCTMVATGSAEDDLRSLVERCYDVRGDHRRLMEALQSPPAERAARFTALRNAYPLRVEFGDIIVDVPGDDVRRRQLARAAGFSLS